MGQRFCFVIDVAAAGTRVDRWLATSLPATSRSEVQRLIRTEQVSVNDRSPKPSYALEAGDVLVVTLPAPPEELAQAEDIPLKIVYEDADIMVVDKPAGMVVHPAPGHQGGTLVNALLHHCPDIGYTGSGVQRPGIVHRLDKDTSGLLVAAKHARALRYLQQQFKARTVHKEYLALVDGLPEPAEQTIDVPLGRHPVDRKRQAAIPPELQNERIRARPAETTIRRIAMYSVPVKGSNAVGHFSLVSAFPHTGRTHQIRVHLAWIKHPIVGDPLYGLKPPRLPLPRLFLHAHRLGFSLPASGESVEFVASLPPDLESVLDRLTKGM